ncbi:MAG: rubrerythrin [Nitrospinae bacterium]|nr:rubrerythrin [Nitrospinota bacterium]
MTEDKRIVEEEILAILEEAIREERESASRYQKGLALAADPEVKSMFERLIRDEETHERVLKERYYEIKKRLGLKVMKDK